MGKDLRLLAVLAALPLMMVSCSGDDDDTLSISERSVTLHKGETVSLTPSKVSIWASDNEFIAEVNNGVVTANHVGSTDVTASYNGHTATCRVTVEPEYTTFTDPYLTFGSAAGIIRAYELRALTSESTDALVYQGENDIVSGVQYIFTSGALTSVLVLIHHGNKTALASEIVSFLNERYDKVSATVSDSYIWVRRGADGNIDMAVYVVPNITGYSGYMSIYYVPYTQ